MLRGTETLTVTVIAQSDFPRGIFIGPAGTLANPDRVTRDAVKAGQPCDGIMLGDPVVIAGPGGLTKGYGVVADGSGRPIQATTGQVRLGVALDNATEGDEARVLLIPRAVEP